MRSIARLKDEARRHEQAEDWAKAIDAYMQVVELGDQPDGDGERELPLFNRIGDLFVRLGRPVDAVGYYEDAADRYADAGLYNNAIALCNKALRYLPDRVELYRKLGSFSAAQGFLTDARRWFLEYAEAMFRLGREDDAFDALGELAALSKDPEMRLLLGRKLHASGRSEAAVVELTRAYGAYLGAAEDEQAAAVRAEIMAIDGDADPDAAVALAAAQAELEAAQAARARAEAEAESEAESEADTVHASDAPAAGHAGAGVDGAAHGGEPAAVAGADEDGPGVTIAGLEATAHDAASSLPELGGAQLEGFEATDLGGTAPDAGGAPAGGVAEPGALPELGAEPVDFELPPPEAALDEESDPAFDLPLLDFGSPAALPPHVGGVDLHAGLAEAWQELEGGRADSARAALDTLHARLAEQGRFADAVAAIDARIELDPEAVALHRQRVEYAQRTDDQETLVAAYEALAAALARAGATDHAAAVREQLGQLDAGSAAPNGTPPDVAPAGAAAGGARGIRDDDGDFVDLGAMLAAERATETRFFVEEKAPTGDEDVDFAELLAQFKTKLAESFDHEDAGSHYDLGLAFKEMGLLDEAIAEFQVAMRAGDGRLRIFEELGHCFFLKGQHGIALKVLQRALDLKPDDELELIGVYYYLGRAAEATGQTDAARDAYERVLGLELNFQDVEQRLARL